MVAYYPLRRGMVSLQKGIRARASELACVTPWGDARMPVFVRAPRSRSQRAASYVGLATGCSRRACSADRRGT